MGVVRLYRSDAYPGQWIAFVGGSGWYRFPGRENGWQMRQPAGGVPREQLQAVPLRMSFNTGLWEEHLASRRCRAA
jgi:hypothetical protein